MLERLKRINPFAARRAFAAAAPDKGDALGRLVTGARVGSGAAMHAAWDPYLNGNPLATLQQVQPTARASGALGVFILNAANLYDLMDEMADKDTAIGNSISMKAAMILARESRFEPGDETPRAAEIANAIEDALDRIESGFGFHAMREAMLAGRIRHGFAVSEIVWGVRSGMIVPSALIHRHPGQFVFSEDGELGLWRGWSPGALARPTGDGIDAAPGKFIVSHGRALYGNPYGEPDIYPLRFAYAMKKSVLKGLVEWLERYGMPLLKGGVREGATEPDRHLRDLEGIIRGITRETGVVLNEYQMLDYIERATGSGIAPHQAAINYFDAEITRRVLGSTLMVKEAEFGTRAQADIHKSVSEMAIAPDAAALDAAINAGLVRPFVEFNYGPDAPVPVFKTDMDRAADVDQAMRIIEAAQRMGMRLSAGQIREWLGAAQPADDGDAIPSLAMPGAMTLNEVRAALGLAPLAEGGDAMFGAAPAPAAESDRRFGPLPFSEAKKKALAKPNPNRPADWTARLIARSRRHGPS